jgi:hypothetical protein
MMKVQQTATGLVFERQPPDAAELVRQGGFTYAAASAASIRDTLDTKSVKELEAIGATYPAHRSHSSIAYPIVGDYRTGLVAALIPAIEAGNITLS